MQFCKLVCAKREWSYSTSACPCRHVPLTGPVRDLSITACLCSFPADTRNVLLPSFHKTQSHQYICFRLGKPGIEVRSVMRRKHPDVICVMSRKVNLEREQIQRRFQPCTLVLLKNLADVRNKCVVCSSQVLCVRNESLRNQAKNSAISTSLAKETDWSFILQHSDLDIFLLRTLLCRFHRKRCVWINQVTGSLCSVEKVKLLIQHSLLSLKLCKTSDANWIKWQVKFK